MVQNTSPAVMARRREPADSLDFFPTPPWAARALCEHVLGYRPGSAGDLIAWEPACGAGHLVRPLADYVGTVRASDIADRGFGVRHDFLAADPSPWAGQPAPHLVVTNPPFRLAAAFARRALAETRGVAAILARTAFLEGGERWRDLFRPFPPSCIAQFAERLPIHKGRCLRTASTATAYCWLVWRKDHPLKPGQAPSFLWIPPGARRALERPGDYDDDPGEDRLIAEMLGGAA